MINNFDKCIEKEKDLEQTHQSLMEILGQAYLVR